MFADLGHFNVRAVQVIYLFSDILKISIFFPFLLFFCFYYDKQEMYVSEVPITLNPNSDWL
jgi:hypothetical protein